MSNFKQQLEQEQKPIQQPIPKDQPMKAENQPKKPKNKPKQPREYEPQFITFMCTGMNGCDFEFFSPSDLKGDLIRKTINEQII